MRRIEAKILPTPSAATSRKRRRKLELIPGQEKISKYFRVQEKPAISQKEPLGSQEGTSKGVNLDPLLGDTSQGASRKPSQGSSCPAPEERGGGGESEGKKRRKSILEMWQNLSDQNQTQQGRHIGNVRGRGRARKAKKERNEEIETPRKRPEKEKE